jgi:hypothetical protein
MKGPALRARSLGAPPRRVALMIMKASAKPQPKIKHKRGERSASHFEERRRKKRRRIQARRFQTAATAGELVEAACSCLALSICKAVKLSSDAA